MPVAASEGNFFEDFRLEQVIEHVGGRTLTEGDAALYIGLTGDRYPLYCDAAFARAHGYRRELINDLLVFHVVFGKTVPDISLNAVANLGYADVRWTAPVYPGDTLRARSTVIGLKENSNRRTGNVYVRTESFNQNGAPVLSYCRWVMVHKRDPDASCGEPVIPELPAFLGPDALHVPDERAVSPSYGGRWFWEDYTPGDRVQHHAGMTLTESEHATATRLYQNTAKVHFDSRLMAGSRSGKRLVYGGHVVSLARALAFNGFENVLRVLAWNGGAHTNPVFAGDTLYAFTEVLDKQPLPRRSDAGALRLRLIAVKDHDPGAEPLEIKVYDTKMSKETYHPAVVLDLDYWVMAPTRSGAAP